MGWGLDVHWAALAREHGWRCGVVDAVADPPPRGAAAAAYPREEAIAEARAFLAERPYLSAQRGAAHPDDASPLVKGGGPKVAVVAEFYPSRRDPVLGVWAHRQALAARDAGRRGARARAAPAGAAARLARRRAAAGAARASCASALREPRSQVRDGLQVAYVPYVSPPRERSYPSWGAWAAPALALRAAPAAPLVRLRAGPRAQRRAGRRRGRALRPCRACRSSSPCTAATCSTPRAAARPGAAAVARGLGAARLVLANSQGIAELARATRRGRDARRAPRRRPARRLAARHARAERGRRRS